jgi:hypothetical protein
MEQVVLVDSQPTRRTTRPKALHVHVTGFIA